MKKIEISKSPIPSLALLTLIVCSRLASPSVSAASSVISDSEIQGQVMAYSVFDTCVLERAKLPALLNSVTTENGPQKMCEDMFEAGLVLYKIGYKTFPANSDYWKGYSVSCQDEVFEAVKAKMAALDFEAICQGVVNIKADPSKCEDKDRIWWNTYWLGAQALGLKGPGLCLPKRRASS